MAETSALRAYSVQADESGCVIFATSHVEARRIGAQDLDTEFEGIESCRLAPEFDQYAPGPVPIRALLEHDWRWECFGCSRMIHGMEVEDDETGDCHEPVFHGKGVYCTQDCLDSDLRERAERKQQEADLRAEFATHFPDCIVAYLSGIPVSSVRFTFPGSKYGAWWRREDPKHVGIILADMPAWEAYREAKKLEKEIVTA